MNVLKAVTMMTGKKPSKRKQLFDFMETESESQTEIKDEVTQYLSDKDGSKHKSALLFWGKKEANYPKLSKVVKKNISCSSNIRSC